jgi:hypothetical protein
MNSKNETGAVELMLLAGLALLWATLTVVRTLVVPVVALMVVMLTPRRRPAPQPAAVAAEAAPLPVAAPEAAVAPEAPAVTTERPLAPVVVPTLADVAADLMALPARRLMEMAGTRRKASKQALVAMVCAMPI